MEDFCLDRYRSLFHALRRYWRLWLPLVWLVLLPAAPAQGTVAAVDLGWLEDQVALTPLARHLVDTSDRLTLKDVLQKPDTHWQDNPDGTINFRQSPHPFWFHVRLKGLAELRHSSYLRLNYPHLDELDLYLVRDGQVIAEYHTGDTRPFNTRPVPHRLYLFPLNDIHDEIATPAATDTLDLYLRTASAGPMLVPLDILTRDALDRDDKQMNLWIGAYFGILAIMLLYNGLIFLFVRDLSYFLYIVYITCTGLLQLTLYGLSFQYLWPHSSSLNNMMILAMTAMMPFSAIAFVWRFVDLGRIGSWPEKLYALAMYAGFGVVFVGAFTLPYMSMLKLAHTLSFLSVSLGFYLGLKYWIRGIKAARVFALAWFIYLLFILYYLLDITGAIQPDFISQHALEIGSVLELALLSLAFVDRLNEERELRLNAQLELNQALDELVQARTGELEEANRKLKELSITDGLTGLCNRRHFDELLAGEYQRAFREKSALAVLLIDIDHFKQINDTHGHPFGDLCIQQVAEVIRRAVRRPPDVAARYGGEEFVVVLPNTDRAGAVSVAESIRGNLGMLPVSDGERTASLSASIGVATIVPSLRDGHEQLLQRADACLYAAKRGGRNRVVSEPPTSPSPS